MNHYKIILLLLVSNSLLSMNKKNSQLEVASGRKGYIQKATVQRAQGFCPFDDKDTLAKNYIVVEDVNRDVRVILNSNYYFPFDQGRQFVIMPITHEENPDKITKKQLESICYEVQKLSNVFYNDAFHQEVVTNWTPMAGQSLPHWHSHFKDHEKEPLSLPDYMAAFKNPHITTIEAAFEDIKNKLSSMMFTPLYNKEIKHKAGCDCCFIGINSNYDEKNLVFVRFPHNFVCLSHHPSVPAELAVVPYYHASSIKDLPYETFVENMVIATALMRKVQKYAHENIRECSGANLYTKSLGAQALKNDLKKYHIHTRVMPRTIIVPTPGTLTGDSCKLDFDPLHFFEYAKTMIAEVAQCLNKE